MIRWVDVDMATIIITRVLVFCVRDIGKISASDTGVVPPISG